MPAPSEAVIRPYNTDDETRLIELWRVSGLVVPWNDPRRDIQRKLAVQPDMLLVACIGTPAVIVGSIMVGYDGHRGWINYLAVHPEHGRSGLGTQLIAEAERLLRARGCAKINLQIRRNNKAVVKFYEALGFKVDDVLSMGKRLEHDGPAPGSAAVAFREMDRTELHRISEIDRAEEVREAYVMKDSGLALQSVHWSVPRWTDDGGEHSVQAMLEAWRPWVEEGRLFGAFDGELLVGFAVYRPEVSPGVAQLAVLHVSRQYRGRGIGRTLSELVMNTAREEGAESLYVSATETRATVDFYWNLGFRPADPVDPELFRLEPEDIHMTMRL